MRDRKFGSQQDEIQKNASGRDGTGLKCLETIGTGRDGLKKEKEKCRPLCLTY